MPDTGAPQGKRYPFLPPDPDIGWLPYLWLIYSLQIPLAVWLRGGGWLNWLIAAVALALFLPLYFYGHWVKGRRAVLVAGALVVLAVVFARWHPVAMVFFIYAASPLARGELRRWWWWLAGMLVMIAAVGVWLRLGFAWPASTATMSVIVGVSVAHDAERRQINRRLQLAQEEIERLAQIAERERIARDLHDLLGHTLSVVVLKSELAARLSSTDPARAAVEIGEVETIARDALTQVRAAVSGYKSVGLAAELDHARKALESAGVRLENEITATAAGLSASQEGVLTLAIREAVTNIVRHAAGATLCRLSLDRRDGVAELRIADDGRGNVAGGGADGFGIRGMRERVEALGGTVTRRTGGGTELVIRLPI